MKCLIRNKSKFHYASYNKKEAILDDYGNKTGEYVIVYNNPKECYGNISPARGEIINRQFGEEDPYDKVIVLDKNAIDIDEQAVMWIDIIPKLNPDGTLVKNEKGQVLTPYDYVVKKIARSLNNVSIAISKVNVS